ncbi:membrane protein [Arthrobacter phage Atuin]|nr:membrane protein [Arthrobacter phage Atuin]
MVWHALKVIACWFLIVLFAVTGIILCTTGLWGVGLIYLGGSLGLLGVWGVD